MRARVRIAAPARTGVLFTATGIPVAQGSSTAVISHTTGRAFILPDNRKALREWRKRIAAEAHLAMAGAAPFDCPLRVAVVFHLPRPKTVKRDYPDRPPDLDKLLRAAGDAMTGVVYTDDARVCQWSATKVYGTPPRADFTVRVLE